jgi:membrane protein YqaA with SNARE-associated domain
VGLAGGLGAAFGEMTGYWAGYSGRAIIPQSKIYQRFEKWLDKWGMLTVFGLSVAPLFFDLVGLAAGVMRFPFWRFFLACWWGRTVLYIVIAWAGALGWDSLLDLLD